MPIVILLLVAFATAQGVPQLQESHSVLVRVVDENGLAVPNALVTISISGKWLQLHTDYGGKAEFRSSLSIPYQVRAEKPGYYLLFVKEVNPSARNLDLTLTHEQQVRQSVDVVEAAPAIDPAQIAQVSRMDTPEIDNIPYPTSRDIRNLLPFNPMVVQDSTGQVHVAGSNTYQTTDLLDEFNMTSPVSGILAMRFSADAVRSIEVASTRYPVEYGGTTGGIIAFRSGMGDNHFRVNATNFIPSVQNRDGLAFDKWVPRVTFSGPIRKGKTWFFDGVESEYDNIIVPELPDNANSNHLWRVSNLAKAQVNVTSANILTLGLLLNDYHSPYEGLSLLTPQDATMNRDTIAGLAYVRDQHSFANGTVLNWGVGVTHFRDGYEPHGHSQFTINPEESNGSYFENLVSHSLRVQQTADVYVPPKQWAGHHDLKFGLDLEQIKYNQQASRQPIDYLREDGTLLRRSTFAQQPYYSHGNSVVGAYAEDRWAVSDHLLFEPGVRFDWDEIVRDPLFSPRLAFTYVPSNEANTKISAGIGVYYDHTQLEYLERSFQSARSDTYFAADGVTQLGPPLPTNFVLPHSLSAPRVINWSIGFEQKLPASIYLRTNFIEKRGTDGFVYLNENPANVLSGTYILSNTRHDKYDGVDFSLRRTFAHGYTLFGSYTRSSARTNQALEYFPTLSILGPQGSGPLSWDTPNRLLSWGWLPVPFTNRFTFVYAMEWRTGFAFSAVNANQQLVGSPNSFRFPDYVSFSPGLEWRFHLRGYFLGLRAVLENATDHANPFTVNNVTDSPQFLTFSNFEGRAVTARIRVIGRK